MPQHHKSPLIVADDDPGVLSLVSSILEPDGFSVFSCRSSDSALDLLKEIHPALFVLDLRLRPDDGLTVCRRVRTVSDVPILMVAADAGPLDAASAFEAGVDDFVRKPFGSDEFRARVGALLRRVAVTPSLRARIAVGPLVIDGERGLASLNAQDLELSATEFAVLGYLMQQRDRVITHERLLEAIWGKEYIDCRQLLRVTICRLRRKFSGSRDLVQTVPRVGYRLRLAEEAA